MDVLRKLYSLLNPREQRNLFVVFAAVLVMAGLQVLSVASIMPFLSVAANPASVRKNEYLHWAFDTFGFADTSSFLIALGLGALAILIASNGFIIFTRWLMERYAWGRNHSLSRRLLRSYLYRPYEYFLTRNSAELGKNILEEVEEVTDQMLKPTLLGIAKGIVALFIVGFLVYFDPVVAVMVTLVLGSAYGGIYLFIRHRLDQRGEERVASNTERYQFVSEAFGGIKEVKIRGKEEAFLNLYDDPSRRYTWNQAIFRVLKRAPRYIIEAVAFGGIILIAIYLIAVRDGIQQVIPVLGLYAFAGYRLMPALQVAFHGLASARFNLAALNQLHQELAEQPASPPEKSADETSLPLTERLELQNVHFTYPDAQTPAIENLSLTIPAQTTTGFVGKTGSGKTTAVDLILGLLRPQQGHVLVDGTPLEEDHLRRWQRNIGYVPQAIYLSDDSIARNIAFGVAPDDIDMAAVKEAARRAHIYEFVDNELPEQWQTVVGERGVKLSGGQRQRIGIARALYHGPSVLVFDEATSALDQTTEKSVMNAIYELEEEHTILLIAHRLSTVQRADRIFMLEDGEKVGEGTYDELLSDHPRFRSMALSGSD
jgi:ATP-binding cassette subfamily C protein